MKKQIFAVATIASVLVMPAQVFAREGADDSTQGGLLNKVTQTVDSTVDTVRSTTKSTVEDNVKKVEDKVLSQKERVEARKSELKQEMSERAEERQDKLEGRRLAKCQNRQEQINALITKSTTIGKDRLARIQAYEAAIKKFYVDQSLSSESYDSVASVVDQKEAEAIAALEVAGDQTYECQDVDGSNPSGEIRSVHDTKREALKEYRDSVKELLNVVRQAFVVKKEAADETN